MQAARERRASARLSLSIWAVHAYQHRNREQGPKSAQWKRQARRGELLVFGHVCVCVFVVGPLITLWLTASQRYAYVHRARHRGKKWDVFRVSGAGGGRGGKYCAGFVFRSAKGLVAEWEGSSGSRTLAAMMSFGDCDLPFDRFLTPRKCPRKMTHWCGKKTITK
jgi:hypothetical protein